MPLKFRPVAAGVVTGAVLATLVTVADPAHADPYGGHPSSSDTTSAAERRRVDRVPTPTITWAPCYDLGECATVELPLDYDRPTGETVDVAVARVKAADPAKRVGSLFINPGGPGGSGVQMALLAQFALGQDVLDRFDIVGFDPRGLEFTGTTPVRCFPGVAEQDKAYAGLNVAFPWGAEQEKAYLASTNAIGKACSTRGGPIAGAMSTAEAARDMDVLRRAVGDTRLTYLGFSYGTALGQFYANMFPDRFRAIAIDGVLDAEAWTGAGSNGRSTLEDRLDSGGGAYRALREILVRCATFPADKCALNYVGKPVTVFDQVARRLQKKPLQVPVPDGEPFTITYADFVGRLLSSLYAPDSALTVVNFVYDVYLEQERAGSSNLVASRAALLAKAPAGPELPDDPELPPYNNGFEMFSGVVCTDGVHPRSDRSWPQAAAAADRRAPHFGRLWAWSTSQCARNAWTVQDEDAYRGPFDRRTAATVLVIGNYYDPATNYDAAVSSAKLLKNARLLSSDSWGHTAYGSSACATGAIEAYLVAGTLPAKGTVCKGDQQPFEWDDQQRTAGAQRRLPIEPFIPAPVPPRQP
jgi:pimeloyl-ACP methyl ester carboxylesterase